MASQISICLTPMLQVSGVKHSAKSNYPLNLTLQSSTGILVYILIYLFSVSCIRFIFSTSLVSGKILNVGLACTLYIYKIYEFFRFRYKQFSTIFQTCQHNRVLRFFQIFKIENKVEVLLICHYFFTCLLCAEI